ncbi:MAG: peptide deformylase [Gammaproteobacteria bacterium]
MTILDILIYPDPRLRLVAKPVEKVDSSIHRLLDDMLETMYDESGIGLAATQVDVQKRILVADVSANQDSPLYLINPVISQAEGVKEREEGCLSLPEVGEVVERAENIHVKALDRNGKEIELDADGTLAICIQHEIDHLDGKLLVDYISVLKRNRIRKKMEKRLRQAS